MRKTLNLIIIFCLLFVFSQSAFASICAYTGNTVTSATLATCSLSGGDGQDCRPYGWFYKSECTVESTITTEATACYNKNMAFDGITGCTGNCLVSGNCINETTGVCQVAAANSCLANENRNANCDGTCDGIRSGYTQCTVNTGNDCKASLGNFVCQIDYSDASGRQDSSALNTCDRQGKTLKDACTGECSSCPNYAADDGTCIDHPFYYDSSASAFMGWTGSLWELIGGGVFNSIEEIINELLDVSNSEFFNQLKDALQSEFVGLSNTYSDGSFLGYLSANNACSAKDFGVGIGTGSHICTADEIIRTYTTDPAAVGITVTGNAWINNGPPGYDQTDANDCSGWNSNSGEKFGSVWRFDTDDSGISPCILSMRFACCK